MSTKQEFLSLLSKVHDQLESRDFMEHASGFDRRPLIRRANSLGGPPMKLIHWKTLRNLKRIPHSEEDHAVEAISVIDRFGAPQVEIFMVSHRWLRPSRNRNTAHPDTPENQKAKAINEFSKWRRNWVKNKHGFWPEIYYWIDFPCIDQTKTDLAVALLPLWVSCCERFLKIDSADYDSRAWCRLEPLLSYAYSFADHHLSIDLNYKSSWPETGEPIQLPILNPTAAETTLPSDLDLIAPLTSLSMEVQPANSTKRAIEFGSTSVKCFKL